MLTHEAPRIFLRVGVRRRHDVELADLRRAVEQLHGVLICEEAIHAHKRREYTASFSMAGVRVQGAPRYRPKPRRAPR